MKYAVYGILTPRALMPCGGYPHATGPNALFRMFSQVWWFGVMHGFPR